MPSKRALIVDDSRVARLALSRMLEQLGMEIDTADSGENALDYLSRNQPDVIFLDHMMPGMDGLEALQAIKENPSTEGIPVMMYTSKKNDDYVLQAQSLGAAAVFPKEVGPDELRHTLTDKGLISEPTPTRPSMELPFDVSVLDEDLSQPAQQESTPASSTQSTAQLLAAYRQGLREELGLVIDEALERVAQQRTPLSNRQFYLRVLIIIGLLVAFPVWYYKLYVSAQESEQLNVDTNTKLLTEMTKQQAEQSMVNETLELQVRKLNQQAARSTKALIDTLNWSLNTSGSYEFGERPLSEERLRTLRNLTNRLAATEFGGTVVIHVHQGQFCLQRTAYDGLLLAADATSVDKCDSETFLEEQPTPTSQLMSLEFADYLETIPLLTENRVNAEIEVHGRSEPVVPYPDRSEEVTAGQWNKAARHNNRVVFKLVGNAPEG